MVIVEKQKIPKWSEDEQKVENFGRIWSRKDNRKNVHVWKGKTYLAGCTNTIFIQMYIFTLIFLLIVIRRQLFTD
jgi:hypothetical protein